MFRRIGRSFIDNWWYSINIILYIIYNNNVNRKKFDIGTINRDVPNFWSNCVLIVMLSYFKYLLIFTIIIRFA